MSDYNQRNIVIILGAGASIEAGAPLMNNFFDRARQLYTRKEIKGLAGDDFDKVFNAINMLQSTHSKANLDLYNLETIFTAFEFANLLQINDTFDKELISSLKKVIAVTIENSLKFQAGSDRDPGFLPSKAYRSFAENIFELQKKDYNVTILSFNYDLALDFAFINRNIPYSYWLSDQSPAQHHISYLKLHGSFNWRRCQKCNEIVTIDLKPFHKNEKLALFQQNYGHIHVGIGNHNTGHSIKCDGQIDDVCFLVPPSWNKQGYYESISRIWKQAATKLSEAAYIYVYGYSLPQTDQFFHNLYALGTMGGSPLHCFNVYNPDKTGATEERFKALLGTGTKNRFKYVSGDEGQFSKSVSNILEILN